jgi:hypothetical protein
MYNNSSITNCAVTESNITSLAELGCVSLNTIGYVYMGGIAGSVGPATGAADPGDGHRYKIENCYVSANIETELDSAGQYGYRISTGGIVGKIHNQEVFPKNCLYKGIINTNKNYALDNSTGRIYRTNFWRIRRRWKNSFCF